MYYYCLLYFDSFTILVLDVNIRPAVACSGLAMETLEQSVAYVPGCAVKTPERCNWHRAGDFIVGFGDNWHHALVFLLLTSGK